MEKEFFETELSENPEKKKKERGTVKRCAEILNGLQNLKI